MIGHRGHAVVGLNDRYPEIPAGEPVAEYAIAGHLSVRPFGSIQIMLIWCRPGTLPIMATIAFLGLGLMGTPMAAALLRAGHQVTVWDRDPAKTAGMAESGAVPAATPLAAALAAPVVITMLSDAMAVRGVLTGPDGVAAGRPDVIIQCSTVSPAELTGIATSLPQGTLLLDAPVRGSVPQARAGELRIFVGGELQAYQRYRDVLTALGEPVHVGPAGHASAVKLVLNAATAPMIALLGEALALGDALGLSEQLMLDELAGTRIGPLVERKREAITTGRFPPDSRLALFAKDMRLVVDTARQRGVPMELASAVCGLAEQAARAGTADLDYAALVAVLRGRHPAPPRKPSTTATDDCSG
jgi:3-hydroxyisobutyrate dehydrogenase-like beta-hydroxyacid dehydrogenase